jgi:hypothetical protein
MSLAIVCIIFNRTSIVVSERAAFLEPELALKEVIIFSNYI